MTAMPPGFCPHGYDGVTDCPVCDVPTPQQTDAELIAEGVRQERARCRAIVLKVFGSEWKGNEALEAIDRGTK